MAELVMSNTRDAGLVELYKTEYAKRLAIARSIDSQENIAVFQRQTQRSYINARHGGRWFWRCDTDWEIYRRPAMRGLNNGNVCNLKFI